MTTTKMLILAGIAASWLPLISLAQDSKNQGYLVDTYGNNVVNSPTTDLCWRSNDWTPSRAIESCDPAALKAEVPAPRMVAASPLKKPAVPPVPALAKVAMVNATPPSVSFSVDALFVFDKPVLLPEGKASLNDFARQLSGAQYDEILVIGHTDRLGSNEYNQKLSQRRADVVKDYLVGKAVPANRIKTEGQGETQPITQVGDCEGVQSVKIIACLQADRRVHVEVTGAQALTTTLR